MLPGRLHRVTRQGVPNDKKKPAYPYDAVSFDGKELPASWYPERRQDDLLWDEDHRSFRLMSMQGLWYYRKEE